MYRSNEERLTDKLIGEAVISLLKSKSPISTDRLIAQLQFMAASADSINRKTACEQIINEIRHDLADKRARITYEVRDVDNVRHFFNAEGPSDDKKSH
ncbi:hypothetical protein [Rahnella aquatilis]|uniref:Uncharacterized protein n=1 Tax=Rahnella aquatilis (strain ATCC 33071 / DSM 4594 / JCM 1683 / NBRC 105701 / NCIMB 13365 / CIP 78.65) TaxID=745277 RepID=H2J1D9_RAHAC|nr:hypothetical protein [Rahnella aquatilis]AEX54386.1 hypothetical protein Rahaq2_4659 [Rahnella aquatilis CIP 78.65 = ATCC 33071]